jgi:small subunit ribosomal protein S21
MIVVKVGKRIEYSLKEFRKRMDRAGTIKELNSRKTFTKKSVTRRQEIQRAKYRQNGKKL